MLDNITRKRIDDARDILVGKLPDPKSQVEQITVALIYKFMNDMDREFEDLGGEAEFFKGEYADYKWSNIVSKEKSGFEKLNLYAEALEKLSLNNNLPALFRNIFKNVFLPYRDPETFNLFIKEIDGFSYEHSEDLGDAFEYLLSIMSSQGDAGQFRTPRHIIDFIVSIVDPKKNESIIDPACGTAGFLISAYKHIIKENEEKGLTPDEKEKLTKNIVGYDISPDMVRLSLVNLYLHLFPNPEIYEYDTLTNDTRWNDTFDVILANPPFMTPKGGIRPHDKFSIQAKRSEVLFVDYIMEHLNINGRAGVIVPEGIVFQTANAYKNLRKNLVENNYIWAVVSLPSGVFNPYSGVKTSILLMDKEIAKKTNDILFIKIDNDGYDLGAQRRYVTNSDIPKAVDLLKEYKQKIYMGEQFKLNENEDEFAVLARKDDIKTNDYILVGERYRQKEAYHNKKYTMIELEEIVEITSGLWKSEKEPLEIVKILRNTNFTKDGRLNFSDVAEHPVEVRQLEKKLLEKGDIILEKSGGGPSQPVGRVALFDNENKFSYSNFTSRMRVTNDNVNSKFLWCILNHLYNRGETALMQSQTSGIRNLDLKIYKTIKIPVPPYSIQEQIVAEIESYQKIIDGARQIVDNYKPVIKIDPEWDLVELGKVCEVQAGGTPLKSTNEYWENGNINWYSSGELNDLYTTEPKSMITELGVQNSSAKLFPKGSLLIGMYDTAAFKMSILDRDAAFNQAILGIKPNENIKMEFLYLYFMQNKETYLNSRVGARQRNLNKGFISSLNIPSIKLEEQINIIEKVREEMAIVDQNKRLIEIFKQKIKDKINDVWSE